MSKTIQAGQSGIKIDSDILLHGDYFRIDNNLQINSDDSTVLIKDYFLYTPPLSSFEGATLTPNVISLLAVNTNAPTMVAFADPSGF